MMNGVANPADVTKDEAGLVAEEDKHAANLATNGSSTTNGTSSVSKPADNDGDADGDVEVESGCGGCGIYPAPAQRLASRHVFILFFCLKNVFQAMVFTYLIGVQTSIERHFHFSSRQTGFLPSIGELGPLLSSVLLSYLASHGNRPRWMGIGMAIVTCGLLCGFLSYLVVPAPAVRDNTPQSRRLCSAGDAGLAAIGGGATSNVTDACTIDSEGSDIGYLLWSFTYILCASGAQTIFVVSAPYMDDGVSQKDSPLFFAVAGAGRVLGPILGYMLASRCISIYVDPSVDPGITQRDQRWIGAWWIGLLVIAGIVALYGWLISLFPRQLSTEHLSEGQRKQMEEVAKQARVTPSRKEFVARIVGLLRNVILMASNFSLMFFLIAILGFFTYQPKYLEHQFRVNKATATTYSAISKVTLVFGTLFSGFIMRRYRPNARLVTGVTVLIRLVAAGVFLCNLAVTCGIVNDLPGVMTSHGLDITPPCSAGCACTTEEYIPVCHRAGEGGESQSYFSPCHAGCETVINGTAGGGGGGAPNYTDCRCLEDPSIVLTSGLCEGSCETQFKIYLFLAALTGLISSLVSIPHLMVTLRCVRPEDKAMALGLNGVFVALAFAFGPMFVGNLVDGTCLVWEQSCGETGACWVYEPDAFRHSLIWFHTGFYLLSVLCDVIIFLNSKSLKLYLDEDSKKPEKNGTAAAAAAGNGVELTQATHTEEK